MQRAEERPNFSMSLMEVSEPPRLTGMLRVPGTASMRHESPGARG